MTVPQPGQDEGPRHPPLQMALLLLAVTALLVGLAAFSTFG